MSYLSIAVATTEDDIVCMVEGSKEGRKRRKRGVNDKGLKDKRRWGKERSSKLRSGKSGSVDHVFSLRVGWNGPIDFM